MQYRGSRGVAHTSGLRNGEGDETRGTDGRKRLASVRAAARAVVESLEQRQLLAAGDPIINEFLAENDNGLRDVDNERHDWIEIYNPGSASVNLQGWKLQDSANTWTFPSQTIPAKGYLVVFASNKDRAISGQQLHTNFALSNNGEYLALVKPNGEKTSEFNPFPEQVADVSYGLGGTATNVQVMVGAGADAFTHIPSPTTDTLGRTWTGADQSFDHSSWTAGPTGIGYERDPGSQTSYTNLIGTDVGAGMYDVNTSAYIRIPFDVENLPNITKLTLRVKYDDGYIAYVNGQHVGTKNLFGSISHIARAANDRNETLVHQFEELDITQYIGALRNDNNILAIQGLNRTDTSSDFVILPELIAESVDTGGTASLQYMGEPTPGTVNLPGGAGVVKDTTFSVDRGFYDDPFQLAIATETSGAEIRYTLDGSMPTPTHGFVYNGPITIGPALYGTPGGPAKPGVITVRAAAFKAGWNPTNIDAQTYVFLDHVITQDGSGLPNTWGNNNIPDYAMDPRVVGPNAATIKNDLKSLPTVNLSMPMEDWFGAGGVGIYPSGVGVPKAVSMEYFTADGTEGFQIDGGVQIIGGSEGGTSAQRWKTYKLSMRIKFQEIYGDSELAYALFGPDAAEEFDTLVFDAQINKTWLHPDASQRAAAMLIQDQYISDLQNAMSGGAGHGPQGKFVHLYLNGIYWGVYDLHERPDEHFAEEYYGGADEDWDVLSHTANNPNNGGSLATANFADMLSRVRGDVTNPANFALVEEVLDIDDFIDYMLANFYGGNQDWSHKNWYATHNRVDPEGKWRFHSWDAEHVFHTGFGGTINPFVDSTGDNDANSPTEIHQQLTRSPEYRTRFADRVRKHFFNGGALTRENATAMYQARMEEVYDAMVAESARWGDNRRPSLPYTREDWLAHQERLINEFFSVRSDVLLGQLSARGLYPAVNAPDFSQHGGTFNDPVQVSMTKAGGGTIYYTTDGSDPRQPGGALHPNAQLYTGPIQLSQSALLRARTLDGGNWSALTEAPFIIGPPPALRVTEIMYNPAPPGANSPRVADDFEFIELQNLGSTPLELDGFGFRRGIDFTFDAGTTLAPGARIVLVKNAAAFAERYPGVTIGGVYSGSLANGGERLILTTHLGQVIQNFQYSDGWYSHTDGEGFSLVAVDPMASNAELSTKDGWRPGGVPNGGPGVADPGLPVGAVVVNEVLSNPTTPGTGWIELRNTTDAPIDVGGWYLSDDDDNLRKYQIPAGMVIPANGFVTFGQDTHFGVSGGAGVLVPFVLSGLGGDVYLSNNDGTNNVGGYRDAVDFGAAAPGVSFGRHVKSTGEADFYAMSSTSRGEANASPKVGPIVINEIMYGPAGSAHEFVELRNTSGSAVSLFDPANPANTWKFTDGITFAFPQGASIAAGGYALVVGIDPATFRSTYNIPQGVQIFGPYSGNLDNAGEKLELSMPGTPQAGGIVPYIVVDRVHYANAAPWPTSPNATGPSLSRRVGTSYGNDVANWLASPFNGGTPGASNGENDVEPPTVDVTDVTPDPRRLGINSITIVFNEAVLGFDVSDLSLTRNGGSNLLGGSQFLSSSDGRTWVLNGLAGLTGAAGSYVLTLDAAGSGIKDGANNFLVEGASESWTVDLTAPTVDVVDVTPDPRGGSVDEITVVFSEPVTNFDVADLRLTRDGGANLLTGAQTVSTTDGGRTFVVGNLAGLTGVGGTYSLSVITTGGTPAIADAAGNTLASGAADSWVVDASAPTADVVDVTPDPRDEAVDPVTIVFSEPVSGFDLSDVTITRDGVPLVLNETHGVRTTDGGRTWLLEGIANLTQEQGTYVVTVRAQGSGIVDAHGNALAQDASDEFLIDFFDPSVTIENVATDPRTTPVETLGIVFSEPVTGFDLSDLTLTRDGGANLLTGAQTLTPTSERGFTLGNLGALTATPGVYTLTLVAAGSGIVDLAQRPLTSGHFETFTVTADPPFVVTGTEGNDTFYFRRNGDEIEVFDNATGTGSPILVASFANTPRVQVNALGGDDVIILDAVNGQVMPGLDNGIDGGDGNDVVRNLNAIGSLWFRQDSIAASATASTSGVETMQVGPGDYTQLTVTAPLLQVYGENGRVTMEQLSLGDATRFDLGTNDLETGGTTAADLMRLVASARNGGATRWQGPGIGTTAAGALTGLAVVSHGGVKFTYNGDANGDGRVNADDYFRIDQGFLAQPQDPLYAQGDFNYDGRVNADDYFLIDQAFLGQGATLASAGSGDSSPLNSTSSTSPTTAMASAVVAPEEDTKKSRRIPATATTSLFSERRIARRPARR